ncbi:MAG: glycosyltransferase family 2 protein [Patescibacteria group bacterium]
MKNAVIVLPTYNERENVGHIIPAIFDAVKNLTQWDIHILVVDDKSPDGTEVEIKKLQQLYKNLHLLSENKQGLGKAYINGFSYALKNLQPSVLFEMDADLSHDPLLLPHMLQKIEGGADFVLGSRYIPGGSIPHNWGFLRKVYSVLGNLVIQLGFMNLKIHDWTTGYRAIKSWLVKEIVPEMDPYGGYVFQMAFLDKAIKRNAVITEVPLNFVDREKGVSKINVSETILAIYSYVFQNSSFIKYVLVGFTGFAVDFGLTKVGLDILKFPVWLSTVISTLSAMTTNFFLNNYWAFAHKRIKGIIPQVKKYIQFVVVSSGSVLIQTVGMEVSTRMLGMQFWYVYKAIIIGLIIIPYSYFMYNKYVWKK